MKKLLMGLLIFFPLLNYGQDYKVATIPDSIKENADAIKRVEEIHVIIKGVEKAVIKRKRAYTILNEAGDIFAYYSEEYDNFYMLSDISGKMFDSDGKLIKSIKKKDIADVAVNDGESLISDARKKRFAFYNKKYPYTVEFEDEITLNGIFEFPTWIPIEDDRLSVERSTYLVEFPDNYHLRYKQFNYPGTPLKSNNSLSWNITNKKAFVFEKYQPDLREITPNVFVAPSEFVFGGYSGNMSSWKELGIFYAQLYKNRDQLTSEVKLEVHKLTDHLPTNEEKVKVLYSYMQKNTRYVSIQLGIGGMQPFEAKFVAEKKYGDCKALSNYMVSLLKEAGIKANIVAIRSGEGRKGLEEDFPSHSFDHVIACVPSEKDTIWLECTNQTISPGYMGAFTGNRKALLIADDGGYVVNTPDYQANDNLEIRKVHAIIDAEGNLDADIFTSFTGIQQDLQHELIYSVNKEQREKFLNNSINLPTYKIEKSEYKERKGRIPEVDEYLKISAPNYASVSGKRMFIQPNLFDKVSKLPNDNERIFDVKISFAYRDIDTVLIQIPENYKLEAIPKDENIKNKFGEYKIAFQINGNTIKMLRLHELNANKFPAAEYTNMVAFYDAMYKADRAKIVFVKNTD